MQISQKTGPSAYEPVPSGATSPRPISSPPARPKCWTKRSGNVAASSSSLPAISTSFAAHVRGGALHGEARDRRRAAGARRAVVRREARVGAAHRHALGRRRELLGRDLRVRRARALAELGRAHEHGHLAVRLHPHDGGRDRMRAGGEQADRDAAADVRALRLAPADGARGLLDVADDVGVERPAAGAHLLAARAQVGLAHRERIEPAAARELVDLQLADPLQVRRAERAVRAGGRGVRVHAGRVDAVGLEAVGPGRRVAAGRRDARPVVGVGARVEPALDLAAEQAALVRHRGAHARLHAVPARGDHRLEDLVADAHRAPRLARERDGDRLHLGVRLRAEAAAEVGDDHAHLRERHVEQGRQLGAHEERVLAGGVHGDLARRHRRDDRVRLHRVLVDRRGRCTRPRRSGRRGRRRPRPRRDRCGSGNRCCPRAAGARRGRGRARGAAAPRAPARRPGSIACSTSATTGRSSYSTMIACTAAAASASLSAATAATGSPWKRTLSTAITGPVADRVPPELVDVREVAMGQHADDARHRLGGASVDRDDARVRHRRAQHLAVQHPRQHDVARELRLAAQLLGRVAARSRAADLTRRGSLNDAHRAPPRSRARPRGCHGSPCSGRGCPRARAGSPPRRRARRSPAARRS